MSPATTASIEMDIYSIRRDEKLFGKGFCRFGNGALVAGWRVARCLLTQTEGHKNRRDVMAI